MESHLTDVISLPMGGLDMQTFSAPVPDWDRSAMELSQLPIRNYGPSIIMYITQYAVIKFNPI